MSTPRILAFGGSLRTASFNHSVAAQAAEGSRAAGAEVTLIRLRDFPLPLFDEDLEAGSGMPEAARRLKELFLSHDGLLISSPEYNSSYSGALKNALDWVSRKTDADEPFLSALAGKRAALLAASPGKLGGSRGLPLLRQLLTNLSVSVLEAQLTIPEAHEVIGADGVFSDPAVATAAREVGAALARAMKG